MIFYPQRISQAEVEGIRKNHKNVEEISLKTKDGITVKGWFVNNGSAGRPKILFYFGGNAEEVSYLIEKAPEFNDWSLVLINYRGYGQSGGKVSERSLYGDALEIYDHFINRKDIKDPKIAVMGRSIGTGVATYLPSKRKADAVVLVSPYTSLKDVAKAHYPFLPVGLILKYKFDSSKRVPEIKAPVLIMVATEDRTIPPRQSYQLAEKWGGKVTVKEIAGADHNSLSNESGYWAAIAYFLDGI
ncbi:MAG: alpha/beta fold hydrolase [Candidatus Edwardsbacteria bacterium]|nr:alpha/beta fold hydrolase [Candidatus Edwardsbacteria bacterium]